jgi:lipopolysaccharide/colanic/teichoic acid biosynthesis glycosyltransferase
MHDSEPRAQYVMEKTTPNQFVFASKKAVKRTLLRPIKWLDRALRRLMDLVISVVALVALSPVFLLIGIAIKRDSKGPIFYTGPRVGKDGKIFNIIKFRTMFESPASYNGAKITASDDDRITATGKWLRETKLNELPQFINIFKGDMSLVGPRPEDPDILEEWPEDIKKELLSVRPGMTSPASVIYRNEESLLKSTVLMDDYFLKILPSKLRLDLVYLRNRSIMTDLDVLFWTLVAVLPQLKDTAIPQNKLYWGPLSIFISRYLSWFLLDSVIALLAVGVAGLIWRASGPFDLGIRLAFLIGIGISLVFSLFNAILGLNRIEWSRASISNAVLLAASTILATVVLILINVNVGESYPLPRSMLLGAGLLSYLGFVAVRYRERLLVELAGLWVRLRGRVSAIGERVLIIGTGENSALASWLFARHDLAGAFTIVGMVDDDPRKQGMVIDGHKVLGTTGRICDLVKDLDVGIIIFAMENLPPKERLRILGTCRESKARIVLLTDAFQAVRAQIQDLRVTEEDTAPLGSIETDQQLKTARVWLSTELDKVRGFKDLEQIRKRLSEIQERLSE